MKTFRDTPLGALAAGGGSGLFFSLIAVFPFVHFSSPTFHAGGAAVRFILFCCAAGMAGGSLAAIWKKGFQTSVLFGAAAVLVIGGLFFGFGWDPARRMDERGLMDEYRARFPYGRPDLARDEDIQVIEGLVNRYALTRAHMQVVKADLEWLKQKRRDDARRIAELEKTLDRIETINDKGLGKAEARRNSSGFRLPRRDRTPILIW